MKEKKSRKVIMSTPNEAFYQEVDAFITKALNTDA